MDPVPPEPTCGVAEADTEFGQAAGSAGGHPRNPRRSTKKGASRERENSYRMMPGWCRARAATEAARRRRWRPRRPPAATWREGGKMGNGRGEGDERSGPSDLGLTGFKAWFGFGLGRSELGKSNDRQEPQDVRWAVAAWSAQGRRGFLCLRRPRV